MSARAGASAGESMEDLVADYEEIQAAMVREYVTADSEKLSQLLFDLQVEEDPTASELILSLHDAVARVAPGREGPWGAFVRRLRHGLAQRRGGAPGPCARA